MTRSCHDCGRTYDDETCWTLCPHGPLDVAPELFCSSHDLAKPYQPEAWEALGCPDHEPRGGFVTKPTRFVTLDEPELVVPLAKMRKEEEDGR